MSDERDEVRLVDPNSARRVFEVKREELRIGADGLPTPAAIREHKERLIDAMEQHHREARAQVTEKTADRDFAWALDELRAGRIVARAAWCEGAYLLLDTTGLEPVIDAHWAGGHRAAWHPGNVDLFAKDWQRASAAAAA